MTVVLMLALTDVSTAGIIDDYFAPPTIAAITLPNGPVEGGGTITITGTNFRDGTGVTFGGVPSPSVTLERYDRIAVAVPPHDPGFVDLVVITYAGTATTPYEYLAPPAPPVPVPEPAAAPAPAAPAPAPAPTCVVPACAVSPRQPPGPRRSTRGARWRSSRASRGVPGRA
jgi:hypothetical protein